MAPVCDRERTISEEGNGGQLGIRVPLVLIGPRARRNATSAVVQAQYDPNAILNFICDHFGLPRLDVPRSETSGSRHRAAGPGGRRLQRAAFDVDPGTRFVLSQKRQTFSMDQAVQEGL